MLVAGTDSSQERFCQWRLHHSVMTQRSSDHRQMAAKNGAAHYEYTLQRRYLPAGITLSGCWITQLWGGAAWLNHHEALQPPHCRQLGGGILQLQQDNEQLNRVCPAKNCCASCWTKGSSSGQMPRNAHCVGCPRGCQADGLGSARLGVRVLEHLQAINDTPRSGRYGCG